MDEIDVGVHILSFTFVVESLALLIDDYSVIVTPDNCIRFRCSGVDKFAMHAAHRSSSGSSNLESHLEASARVVLQSRSDKLEMFCSWANISAKPETHVSVGLALSITWTYISRLPSNPPQANMTFLPCTLFSFPSLPRTLTPQTSPSSVVISFSACVSHITSTPS